MFSVFISLLFYIFGGYSFNSGALKDLEYIELGRTYNSPGRDNYHSFSPKESAPSSSVELFVHPSDIEKFTKPKKKKKPSKPKVKQPVKVKQPTSPLEEDCVLALKAVGVKKSVAKAEVKAFFSNNNVDTVEDFLREYLKK